MSLCGNFRANYLTVINLIILRIAVLIAIVIYIMAGHDVWKKRDALDGFLNPFNEAPFASVIMTTEVTITSEERNPSLPNLEVQEADKSRLADTYDAYSVNIELGQPRRPLRPQRPSRPAVFRIPSVTRAAALSEANADAFLYARVAFLFFLALLITWVPSSVNRAYALAHPNHLNFGLNFTSAIVFSSQGLLNCLVYMATSQSACRRMWKKLLGRHHKASARNENYMAYTRRRGGERAERQGLDSEATSMTNLTAR